jgi:hypothetical protein
VVHAGGGSFGPSRVDGSGQSAGNGAAAPCNGTCGRGGTAGANGLVVLQCG